MEQLEQTYTPRGECQLPMNPNLPAGCLSGFEPYAFRSGNMLQTSDVFDPCCKKTDCHGLPPDQCKKEAQQRWIKRVIRFFDNARTIINLINEHIDAIEKLSFTKQTQINAYFAIHAEKHTESVQLLDQYYAVASVIIRDLTRCLNVMSIIVDGSTAVPAATLVQPGSTAFDILRAETVASGCGSMEPIMAIVRAEYIPIYNEIATLISTAAGNKSESISKTSWGSKIFSELKNSLNNINVSSMTFYMLTVVPFMYSSVITSMAIGAAALGAGFHFSILTRSIKLICHFGQIPGLVLGLGVVLLRKINDYFITSGAIKHVDDQVSNGAVTYFTVLKKLVMANPTAAVSIAALGYGKTGLLNLKELTVASLGKQKDNTAMTNILQGIVLFFTTMTSSAIWKALGFACETGAKIIAPVAEGTKSLVEGSAVFMGGIGHLSAQIYNAAAQPVGFGLGKIGEAADYMGAQIGTFMDSFTDKNVQQSLNTLKTADATLETTLNGYNNVLSAIFGQFGNDITKLTVEASNQIYKKIESFDPQIVSTFMMAMVMVYAIWTFFQGSSSPKESVVELSLMKEKSLPVDSTLKKWGRVIPRPPVNFVYQQCLREDLTRNEMCVQRAAEWTGLNLCSEEKPPAYCDSVRRGSQRRRQRGSARSKVVNRPSRRRSRRA